MEYSRGCLGGWVVVWPVFPPENVTMTTPLHISCIKLKFPISSRAFSVTERARVCIASEQGHNLGTREPERVRVFPSRVPLAAMVARAFPKLWACSQARVYTKNLTNWFVLILFHYITAAVYGTGVYFASDAWRSMIYTSKKKKTDYRVMYLARVLVGKYCKGSSSMKKPPPINPEQPEILFDSMVNNMLDPSIFVVYYDNQCYPEYLITL